MEHYLVYIAFAMLLYCMYSARIGAFGITMPMVSLAIGVFVGLGDSALDLEAASTFHHLAEVTLALLLFADATSLRRDTLKKIGQRTKRMLLLGLPFAIIIGALLNWLLLTDWPFWEVCLLAALLAPTDAALGQSIRSNTSIPQDFRDAMNAESGLNDGLALPFVIFFAGLAVSDAVPVLGDGSLVKLLVKEICIGAGVGLLGGFVIGKLRNHVIAQNLMDLELGQVAVLVLVGFIFFAAEHFEGNAFVAVFVAGLAYANTVNSTTLPARHFLEGDGQFLAMLSFLFIGVLFVPEALTYLSGVDLVVVILSLVFVRPVAIWLSLMGTKTTPNERLFYGWFGPRGLATALFAVFVAMDFEGIVMIHKIVAIAITAVLISAFAHGFSAKYAAQLFRFDEIERK
ncbi:MAG: cation:proton antiporter [Sedimentitalea sp.]|uniref:cation:proton antiporter n=1 Tax=Sedimentitalea sp. TaxID=2048915 RepID=UPI00326635FC